MNLGLMALEEGARVDFSRLRTERRQRVLASMAEDDLDVVFLGRPANVHYASGARQLWTAGTRPFAPTCVVVRDTGQVHLLSVWDEGIPDEIDRSNLFGISWNPMNLVGALQAIPAIAASRRAGTDSLTPLFAQLLPMVVPDAALVDGSVALSRVRATKTHDELEAIATAAAIAEAGLAALAAALRPGVTERQLLGIFDECLARLGSPVPSGEGVAFVAPRQGPVVHRNIVTDRPVGPGELVVLSPGTLYAGYEATLARTVVVGGKPSAAQTALGTRAHAGLEALVTACRPGATGADLRHAWEATGESLPPVPLAYGLGLGAEPPLIGMGRGDGAVLSPGMVLAVQSWVTANGTGGVLERDTVVVRDEGAQVLTRFETLWP